MTPPAPALLDTDTLSALLRRSPAVVRRARHHLDAYGHLTFSAITRYEILRGLKARGALRQQEAFEDFCAANIVVPLTAAVVVSAAEIYADLRRREELIGDADIPIAATAAVEERAVATNNRRHFDRVEGLRVENWLRDAGGEEAP